MGSPNGRSLKNIIERSPRSSAKIPGLRILSGPISDADEAAALN
jgi:hypothetical protein